MRYFIHIAYLGTDYSGWQRHKGVRSIQELLEKALEKVLKQPANIIGCGRTDKGVHAGQFYFHVDFPNPWAFDLRYRLNQTLPRDISIFEVIAMQGQPHARFDAYQRTYDYFIHTYKDPFLNAVSAYYELGTVNFGEMNKALKLLLEYDDYHAFCKSPLRNQHTLCRITEANLFVHTSGRRFRFQITSNRFLSGMIRILVKKLMDIGTGAWTVDLFEQHLVSRQTPELIKPGYPEGLHLSSVRYPYLDGQTKTLFPSLLYRGLENPWMVSPDEPLG